MKLFLLFEIMGQMPSQHYPLSYLDQELACLCLKESAVLRALQENNKGVFIFCPYYVHLLLLISD